MSAPPGPNAVLKICVIGGFTEGRRHAKKLLHLLEAAGFHVVRQPERADVIITHSGGYLFLPENLTNKTVMMVAPPCGYQATLTKLFFRNWSVDYHSHRQAKAMPAFWRKDVLNFWYFVTRPGYNSRIVRGVGQFRLELLATHAQKTIVVTNRRDLWVKDVPLTAIRNRPAYAFIGLEGAHDDIWLHPERYVAIIQATL